MVVKQSFSCTHWFVPKSKWQYPSTIPTQIAVAHQLELNLCRDACWIMWPWLKCMSLCAWHFLFVYFVNQCVHWAIPIHQLDFFSEIFLWRPKLLLLLFFSKNLYYITITITPFPVIFTITITYYYYPKSDRCGTRWEIPAHTWTFAGCFAFGFNFLCCLILLRHSLPWLSCSTVRSSLKMTSSNFSLSFNLYLHQVTHLILLLLSVGSTWPHSNPSKTFPNPLNGR